MKVLASTGARPDGERRRIAAALSQQAIAELMCPGKDVYKGQDKLAGVFSHRVDDKCVYNGNLRVKSRSLPPHSKIAHLNSPINAPILQPLT